MKIHIIKNEFGVYKANIFDLLTKCILYWIEN